MASLIDRIKESIVCDVALGNRCKTRDDLSEYMEELFCALRAIDWEEEVVNRACLINKSMEDHYNNTIVRCAGCNASITLKESRSVSKKYNLENLPNNCRDFCEQCAPSVVEQYRRVCCLCSTTYVAKNSSHFYDLCEACYTDERMEEYKRVKSHLRRAKVLSLPATLTLKQWLYTLGHFQNRCVYCGSQFTCLDHYVPLGPGGTTQDNCVPACGKCNSSKNKKHPEKYIKKISPERAKAIRDFVSKATAA